MGNYRQGRVKYTFFFILFKTLDQESRIRSFIQNASSEGIPEIAFPIIWKRLYPNVEIPTNLSSNLINSFSHLCRVSVDPKGRFRFTIRKVMKIFI